MVFLGRLLAWALITLGSLRVAIGFYVASLYDDQAAYQAAASRYLGSAGSGEAIDQGLIAIGVGIGFGLLARIARRSA